MIGSVTNVFKGVTGANQGARERTRQTKTSPADVVSPRPPPRTARRVLQSEEYTTDRRPFLNHNRSAGEAARTSRRARTRLRAARRRAP